MNKWLKRLLAIFQIGGGFLGIALIVESLLTNEINTFFAVVSAVFVVLFLFGIITGITLFENEKKALLPSLIYYLLQIPILTTSAIQYSFGSGFFGGIYFGESSFRWDFYLGSRYSFSLNVDTPWAFGINLVALLFFLYLLKVRLSSRYAQMSKVESPSTEAPAIEQPQRPRRLTF